MSVKIMGLVWDLELPQSEKFVLLAYADHADHNGDNMFPSVALVAKKTGYSERSVQRTTRSLEEKGFLVANGKGPKGTNKWKYGRGDKLSGVTNETAGVTPVSPGGDIAMSPEPSLTIKEPSIENSPKKPTANDILFGHNEKIEEQNAMIEEVHRIIGYEPNMGGNGKWERTVKKLVKLKKQGIDLETFWTWNMSEERKYERLTKIKLLQSPGLLTDMMEAESGVFQHKRIEPKDGRGEYV